MKIHKDFQNEILQIYEVRINNYKINIQIQAICDRDKKEFSD